MRIASIVRRLDDLRLDTRYVARIRTINNLGVKSEWSEALDFTTPADTSVPNPPHNLELEFLTPDLVLSWERPTRNTDGSVLLHFSHFSVTISDGTDEFTFETSNPFFVYSFSQNVRNFGGSGVPDLNVEIRSVSISGGQSEPISGSAVNPIPSEPPEPVANAALGMVVMTMSPNPVDIDIKDYLLERTMSSPDEDPGRDSFEEIAISNGSYVDSVESGTYYYRFRTRDHFDQVSPYSPEISVAVTPLMGNYIRAQIPPQTWEGEITYGDHIINAGWGDQVKVIPAVGYYDLHLNVPVETPAEVTVRIRLNGTLLFTDTVWSGRKLQGTWALGPLSPGDIVTVEATVPD